MFGQIINFGVGLTGKFIFMWHGLGKKSYFRVNNISPQSTALRQLLEAVMLLKAEVKGGITKISHPLISSDSISVYYYKFYGIILLCIKKMKSRPVTTLFQIIRRP